MAAALDVVEQENVTLPEHANLAVGGLDLEPALPHEAELAAGCPMPVAEPAIGPEKKRQAFAATGEEISKGGAGGA